MKKRMVCLDILRIILASFIFLRHLITMGGCIFERSEKIILAQTNIVMVAFFCISGFCLYCSSNSFSSPKEILEFYKARLVKIMPLYLSVEIARFLIDVYFDKKGIERIATLPIRLLGIQIHYSVEVFSGVCWFISCLLVCYFIFPLICVLIDKVDKNKKVFCGILILLILSYSQILCIWYSDIDMYYSPFFRSLEFALGMFISAFLLECGERLTLSSKISITLGLFLMLSIYERNILSEWASLLVFPVAALTITCLSWITINTDNTFCKIVVHVSSFTFELFVLQDILFSTPIYILENRMIRGGVNNWKTMFYIGLMLILILVSRLWTDLIKRVSIFGKR